MNLLLVCEAISKQFVTLSFAMKFQASSRPAALVSTPATHRHNTVICGSNWVLRGGPDALHQGRSPQWHEKFVTTVIAVSQSRNGNWFAQISNSSELLEVYNETKAEEAFRGRRFLTWQVR
ncbi:hypothetical protein [Aeoliella sp.]|uniref:hypothetical protein n=1 Tax=Aeoliella sp. TaxID=2795800 RepID=UPI003CCC4145